MVYILLPKGEDATDMESINMLKAYNKEIGIILVSPVRNVRARFGFFGIINRTRKEEGDTQHRQTQTDRQTGRHRQTDRQTDTGIEAIFLFIASTVLINVGGITL